MDEEFEQMLKYLGFRGLHANWDQYMDIAKKGSFSPVCNQAFNSPPKICFKNGPESGIEIPHFI